MDKLKMQTTDVVNENIRRIGELFPNCLTEKLNANGEPEAAIDFDKLKQELSRSIVEGTEERYQFTWPDKRNTIRLANTPTTDTLRPCREDSVDFDNTQNLYIEGDNLEVLKLLRENYLGKVKLIYVDPPYNTGNDFVYDDDFAQDADEYIHNSGQEDEEGNRLVANPETNGRFHTDWLNMIYPRLKVAKDILSKDGIIAISINYYELHNLMELCQEIFNGHQIIAVTIQTSGGKPKGAFSISNEYMVFIVPEEVLPIPTEEDMNSYSSAYHGMNLATFTQIQRPNQVYPIFVNNEGAIIGCGKTLQERIDDGTYSGALGDFVYDYNEAPKGTYAIWPITDKGDQCVWRLVPNTFLENWNKGYIKVVSNSQKKKSDNKFAIQYLTEGIIEKIEDGEFQTYRISNDPNVPTLEINEYKTAGNGIATVWTDKNFYTTQGSNDIRELFNGKIFSYPKPLSLILYLLKRFSSDNDIILDFFSGSGTTAHAVMKLNADDGGNRKFIMVQLQEEPDKEETIKFLDSIGKPHNICEIGKERIRRAGKKIVEEQKNKQPDLFSGKPKTLDVGFRVLKLDSSNMRDVYYTPAEFSEQTLFDDNIKSDRTDEDLLFQAMILLGIELSTKIEKNMVGGKTVWNVAGGELLTCFAEDVNEEVITTIAKQQPKYFVMRDASLSSDQVADNFEQIFKHYSKDTICKII